MKQAYSKQLLTLALALCLLAGFTWAKTKETAAKAGADTEKKKSSAEKDKTDKPKDKPKDDDSLFSKKQDQDDKAGVEVNPDLEELYAEIAEVVQLDEKGQEMLLKLQEQKAKKLDKFDKTYNRKIVAIENEIDRTKNEKKKEKLLNELVKISSGREKLQQKFDNQALRALSKDQRVIWNTYELWVVISPELEFEGEMALTDEQVDKAKAVCNQLAQKRGANARLAQDPKMKRAAIGQIGRQVLTDPQKKEYARLQQQKRLREKMGKTITVETRRGRHH